MKKAEYPLAVQLAQAEYEQKLLRSAQEWQKALSRCLVLLPEHTLADAGPRTPARRQNQIKIEVLADLYDTMGL